MTFKHYIGGKLIAGKGGHAEVINPALEKEVARFKWATSEQATVALGAAEKAFTNWSAMSINQRNAWILKLADSIDREKETILDLLMSETGKPLTNAAFDFSRLVDCLRYFAEEAKRVDGQILCDYNNNVKNLIVKQPLGVVVGYLAWNYPLLNVGYKLGPALASGCTCILKPSSKTPLATMHLGEIAKKINFPPGVLNIIAGPGSEIGNTLNQSSIPKMITMIGSSAAGHDVVKESSTSVKRLSLELGGNAPVIVMPDVNVKRVAEMIIPFKFVNSGQTCISPNRVYVHESIHDEFVKHTKALTKNIKLGWGRQKGAVMGPMITKQARGRLVSLIEDAKEKGAKVVSGGRLPDKKTKGYYFPPTVLDHVTKKMRVHNEEVFGPILPILSFTDRKKVVEDANSTEFGLASFIFSEDVNDVFEIAEALQFGTVSVNRPFWDVNLPHGGIKESGMGKDCSHYSLEEYFYIKRISIALR